MSALYQITDRLEPVSDDAVDPSAPLVEILQKSEFHKIDIDDVDITESLRNLSESSSSYVDIFPTCLIGSLSLPDKTDPLEAPIKIGFYLAEKKLIFVDEKTQCKEIVDELTHMESFKQPTVARVLYEFMKYIVRNDNLYLTEVEEKLGTIEDTILDSKKRVTNHHMLQVRRKLLKLDAFYQQLADMGSLISEDENHLLAKEDRRLFRLFAQQANRLLRHSQMLKEYSLQLRELYQTQIDIQQNETIQWFTVITTIFVPLTLITSWYGMNFRNMPELDWEYGYAIVIVICIVLVAIELAFFKRKKWL